MGSGNKHDAGLLTNSGQSTMIAGHVCWLWRFHIYCSCHTADHVSSYVLLSPHPCLAPDKAPSQRLWFQTACQHTYFYSFCHSRFPSLQMGLLLPRFSSPEENFLHFNLLKVNYSLFSILLFFYPFLFFMLLFLL